MTARDVEIDLVQIGPIKQGQMPYVPYTGPPGTAYTSNSAQLTTLSDTGSSDGTILMGLFWYPVLNDTSPCANDIQVPPDIVTKSNNTLLGLGSESASNLIAFAPWRSPPCQQAYFQAAANVQVNAFLTYLPDNSTGTPPPASDPKWNLGDNDQWKGNYPFPVYAVNGMYGDSLLHVMENYTQPIQGVPNGVLTWLLAQVQTTNSSGLTVLPDLWTIVLAVLAAFIAILGSVSGVLHLLQRKRRRDLRRRIISGQVSLDRIGVRKLTVPPQLLEKMPVCKFAALGGQTTTPAASAGRSTKGASEIGPAMTHHYNQPTCAICLDDFNPDSDVRCLPCDHVFHPECCDSFLLENSSLCPMCKKSVLPMGYCPEKITNAMVRRERLARIREADALAAANSASPANNSSWHSAAAARMRNALHNQAGDGDAGDAESAAAGPPLELQSRPPAVDGNARGQGGAGTFQTTTATPSSPTAAAQAGRGQDCTPSRREWARRRALQLLGPQAQTDAITEADTAYQSRTPRWRRAMSKVFPGSAPS